MATMMAGAKTAGIYPTDTADQIAYKCSHSDARVLVVEDETNLRKFAAVIGEAPAVKTVVVWNPAGVTMTELSGGSVAVKTWDQFKREGEASSADLESRLAQVRPVRRQLRDPLGKLRPQPLERRLQPSPARDRLLLLPVVCELPK